MRIPTVPVRESPQETGAETIELTSAIAEAATAAGLGSAKVTHTDPRPATATTRATFLRSFAHAWDGVIYALRTQRNARVHLAAAVCALGLGVALRLSAVEFALILLAIMAVLVAELFNTVAEAVVDLVTSDYHPLARVAKDVAAGAVLLCALFAVVIALLVFGPHLWPVALRLLAR